MKFREKVRGDAANPMTLRRYVTLSNPRYRWYPHCELLADTLERVARREITRLVISMPPQHGKSELVSRSLPGYELMQNPNSNIMLVSYGADLAYGLSVDARDRYRWIGGALRRDVRSVKWWRTREGGSARAVGIRGAITGHPADMIIVDDPHKNEEDASSPRNQARLEAWWDSTLMTRLVEDGPLVIMCTRWDPKDLVGMVMEREKGDRPERWHVLSLPAITDEEEEEWPDTCTIIPDFRTDVGVPLCPEIRSLEYLRGIESRSLPFYWNSIWQQRPRDPEGFWFRKEWFDRIPIIEPHEVPEGVQRVRAWDKAGTEDGGDWTVGTLMARDDNRIYYIEDVIRGQWEVDEVEEHIHAAARRDDALTRGGLYGPRPEILQEVEPGSSGKAVASMSIRGLEGYPAFGARAETDKVTRAKPLASYMKAGNIRIVRGDWNEAFRKEFLGFRNKKSQSDQVDSAAYAFLHLAVKNGDTLHPHRGGS